MQIVYGDIWTDLQENTVVCVMANSIARPYGLTLGKTTIQRITPFFGPYVAKSAELAVRQAHPGASLNGELVYGFLVVHRPNPIGLALFQVKRHYREHVQLEIFAKSCQMLYQYASLHPHITIRLPMVRGVPRAEAYYQLLSLPDSVHIHHKA